MAELPCLLIMTEIVSRLSGKIATQCKVVCKEWRSFISTKDFAILHCSRMKSLSQKKILAFDKEDKSLHSFFYDSPQCWVEKTVSLPLNAKVDDLLVLSTLDGMLCVCMENTNELVIWNPLTSVHRKLPSSKNYGVYDTRADALGFFVDLYNEYKVLHIKRTGGVIQPYVYSSFSDSWQNIKFIQDYQYYAPNYHWSMGTLSGDGLYFTVMFFGPCVQSLIRFDVNSEEFTELPFPSVISKGGCEGTLVSSRDELHLFVTHGLFKYTVDVWKMDPYKKWMQILSISHTARVPISLWCHISYMVPNKKWIMMTDSGGVCDFDVRNNEFSCLFPSRFFQALERAIYSESLMSTDI